MVKAKKVALRHCNGCMPHCLGKFLYVETNLRNFIYFVCIFLGNLIYFVSRERVPAPKAETSAAQENDVEKRTIATTLDSPRGNSENAVEPISARSLLKSASISASTCIGSNGTTDPEVTVIVIFELSFNSIFNQFLVRGVILHKFPLHLCKDVLTYWLQKS